MTEIVFVRKVEENLWQWRESDSQHNWVGDSFYTGDINLLKETVQGRAVYLLIPGESVVTRIVDAPVKDRRQLLKVLPYDLEEDIVEPVEEMQFAYGPIFEDQIPVAYSVVDVVRNSIDEVERAGADVQRCVVDYLQLPSSLGGWHLLLEGGMVLAHLDRGMGFSVEQESARLFLQALADELSMPQEVTIYGDDEDELETLRSILPDDVLTNDAVDIIEEEAGFWDLLSPKTVPLMDFRAGALARQLPFEQWWQNWKYPVIASAAAFMIAVTGTWLSQQQAKAERKTIMAQTDAIFRQVVPQGRITEPARQLKRMLGDSGATGESSGAVPLIANITPAISSTSNVSVRNFRYSMDNGTLQLNIEADSFETFETLRQKIADTGLTVEIRSANVYGDKHQAQLRITGVSS